MKTAPLLLLALLSPLAACATTVYTSENNSQNATQFAKTVELQDTGSAKLLDTVKALEGNWVTETGDTTMFEVTSMDSVVRETMSAGMPHEMTNMYSLHGNGLTMTHYCGAGNQPHMLATSVQDDRLVFASNGVSGRKTKDEVYMGAMTLVMIDENTIEEIWQTFTNEGPGDTMVLRYERAD